MIAKLSFFTDPHTQFKVDCLLFNHGNTKHWAKKKYSSHHPQHYFKWLVCTNDLLKWKPTYFLSQKKKKKVPTINNDPVLWKDKITQPPWSLKGFSFLGLTEAGIPGSTEPFLTEIQRTKCKLTSIANQMHNAKCKVQPWKSPTTLVHEI